MNNKNNYFKYWQKSLFCFAYFFWGMMFKILNTDNLSLSNNTQITLIRLFNGIAFALLIIFVLLELINANFKIDIFNVIFDILFLLLGFILSGHSTGLVFVVSLLFIVTSGKINFDDSLRVFLFFSLIVFFVTLFLNKIGYLPSQLRVELGRFRNSLGFSYVSFPSQIFFYITCSWVALRRKKITYIEIIFLALMTFYIHKYSQTTSPYILSFLLLLYILVLKIFHINNFLTKFKLTSFLTSFCFPISFFILMWLVLRAPRSLFYKVNNFVNNRLILSFNGLEQYGIGVFGKKVVFSGFDIFGNSTNYNYVDSSYIQNLILNGWLYTTLIIILFTVVSMRAVKNNKEYLTVVLVVISIHSMFDPQLMLLWYSPFSLLLGKIINDPFNKKKYFERTV